MIIINEMKRRLEEAAAIGVISHPKDGLPFRIAIQFPDPATKPRGRLMDLKTGKKELGQFEIPRSMPRRPEDIKDYDGKGISDEWRELIFQWCKKPSKVMLGETNWEFLYVNWQVK